MSASTHQKTLRLTVAQAIVKYLQVQYSELDGTRQRLIPAAFGIYGHGQVAGLGQALFEYGEELPFYQTRNEQSMVHTAIAFAKANLRLSTLACSSSIGPGATNMITGAATALLNRIPVLLLPADYYASRHQGPVLQQLEHVISADMSVNDCFRPVSRRFDRISRPEQLLTALPEAMRVLTDPVETGPVTIALPQDVQMHAYDFPHNFFEERTWRVERPLPSPQRIAEAVKLIKKSQRPIIIAGGGVLYSQARQELETFSQTLGIPVGETFAGRGAIQNDSPLLLGGLGVTGTPLAGKIAAEADLVICVGTRLIDFTTGSRSLFQDPDVSFVHINVSGHDAYKLGALPIVADAREGLRALTSAVNEAGLTANPTYVAEVSKARKVWDTQLRKDVYVQHPNELISQQQLIGIIHDQAVEGDTIICAAGTPPGDLHQLWDATGGRHCHLEFGNSCMGYEIPAGVGVRMAQPDGEVVVFIGDGTYILNPMELITAVQEGRKITLVLSENHGFQSIHRLQRGRTGRSFANEFRTRDPNANKLEGDFIEIDFVKNAESMGARAMKADTVDEIKAALMEARKETGPCVIVVETEKYRYQPGSDVWWDVEAAEVTNDPVTQELRAAYEEERDKRQRYYY